MSYHYGTEPHYQVSLPPNPQLYQGPQEIYDYGKYHNVGMQMVPQPQYPMVPHAPVYHLAAPHPIIASSSSQTYPLEVNLQPQYLSPYVEHRMRPDITSQIQRNVYLPPAPPLPDPVFHPRLRSMPNYVAVPLAPQLQSRLDTNVLDGLPPLKRIQGRFAHTNPTPRWEPKKVQTVDPLDPQFSSSAQRKGTVKGSDRDWSTLQPGQVHTLVPIISLLSCSSFDEDFQDAATHRDTVMYLPRSFKFSGKDTDPDACISFSFDGMPGPYLLDLAETRVTIDGKEDKIFEQFGWRTTKLHIDWPGLSIPPQGFKVVDRDGLPLLRGQLATLVATRIAKMIINTQRGYALPMGQTQKLSGSAKYWNIMKVDYNHLRLISVNYYDKVWVPVLALDIAAYNM